MTNVLSTFVKCVCVKFLCCCARVFAQDSPQKKHERDLVRTDEANNILVSGLHLARLNFLRSLFFYC